MNLRINIKCIVLLITLLSLLTSCAKVKVSQDYDTSFAFGSEKTFGWNNDYQKDRQGIQQDNELLDHRFRKAIENNLKLKGFKDSQTPAILVSYDYTVSSRLQAEPATTGFGFGYGRYGSHARIGMHTGSSIRQYDQGKLVIYIHSASTNQLLWMGTGTREVFTHSNPEKITREVDETVAAVIKQFPPVTELKN